jgi:hypothetical protein
MKYTKDASRRLVKKWPNLHKSPTQGPRLHFDAQNNDVVAFTTAREQCTGFGAQPRRDSRTSHRSNDCNERLASTGRVPHASLAWEIRLDARPTAEPHPRYNLVIHADNMYYNG